MKTWITALVLLICSLSFAQSDTCNIYASNVVLPWCCSTSDCDKFKIYSDCQIAEFHLEIFSKWGELVFKSNDPDEFWIPERIDYELVNLSEGVYIWVLRGKMTIDFDLDGDTEDQDFERRGVVTLLD